MSLVEAALEWAAWGMPVIPVHGINPDGTCTCGDPEHTAEHKSTGKHPVLRYWYGQATTDPEQIRSWWVDNPRYNIGGVPAKAQLIAVDADGEAGCASMAEYEQASGDLPTTLCTRSGSGTGMHAFFKIPSGGENPSRISFLPKVDTRGIGGQIVLPPSVHRTGGAYELLERPRYADLPTIPAALYGLICVTSRKQHPVVAFQPEEVSDDEREAGVIWWRQQLATAASWISGLSDGRHEAVLKKARWLAAFLWLDPELEEELFKTLWDAVDLSGGRDENDTRNAILWGIQKGKESPLPVSEKPDEPVYQEVAIRTSTGKVKIPPTFGAARKILANDYRFLDRIRYDILAGRPSFDGELLTDDLTSNVKGWLEDVYKVAYSTETVREALYNVSRSNEFHPVIEHIRAVEWDGIERLHRLFYDYFTPPEHLYLEPDEKPQPYSTQHLYQEYGKLFMISLVARCVLPGCKADSMPVLQGPGGIGKSTGFKCLAFGEIDGPSRWFSSTRLPMDDDKRKYQLLKGNILIERAEFKPSDWESEKDFIAQTEDKYIPMFGKEPVAELRTAVFCATSNAEGFIPQADRRVQVIECASVQVDAILQDRDQLWAEALARYDRGEVHHIEDARLEQAQLADVRRFEVTDDRTMDEIEKISDWLDGLPTALREELESIGVALEDVCKKDAKPRVSENQAASRSPWAQGLDRHTRTARKAALKRLGWLEKTHPRRWVYPLAVTKSAASVTTDADELV